jgi:hypothetical protein
MRLLRAALAVLLFLAAMPSAGAATASGPSALALAALVAAQSPQLSTTQKHRLAQAFNGVIPATPSQYGVTVRAKSIVCRESDVDLTARGCSLQFGALTVLLTGRAAKELFATMRETGVAALGAAGTIYERVMALSCTVDFGRLRMRDGGGASCRYR